MNIFKKKEPSVLEIKDKEGNEIYEKFMKTLAAEAKQPQTTQQQTVVKQNIWTIGTGQVVSVAGGAGGGGNGGAGVHVNSGIAVGSSGGSMWTTTPRHYSDKKFIMNIEEHWFDVFGGMLSKANHDITEKHLFELVQLNSNQECVVVVIEAVPPGSITTKIREITKHIENRILRCSDVVFEKKRISRDVSTKYIVTDYEGGSSLYLFDEPTEEDRIIFLMVKG